MEKIIAPLRGNAPTIAPPSAQQSNRRASRRIGRRAFLRSAVVGGSVVGLSAMRIFPAAREAWADTSGYTIFTDGNGGPCAGGYAENDNCTGCDRVPCDGQICCVTDPSRAHYKYMKSQAHGYQNFGLRPNECISGTGNDGWHWQYNDPCGNCTTGVIFRCHDGWEAIGGTWSKTTCRWKLGCW